MEEVGAYVHPTYPGLAVNWTDDKVGCGVKREFWVTHLDSGTRLNDVGIPNVVAAKRLCAEVSGFVDWTMPQEDLVRASREDAEFKSALQRTFGPYWERPLEKP